MGHAVFDTLEFVNELKKGGMDQRQAEACARASSRAFGQIADARELATKKDILELGAQLRLEMAAMKTELVKWMVGLIFGLGAFLVAVMAYLR